MSDYQSHAVWDVGTRAFHWINVLCIIGLAAIGLMILNEGALGFGNDGKVQLKTVHTLIGYVFAVNLLWRFVWAFVGNDYARWRAILPGGRGYGRSLRSYIAAFVSGRPQTYLGHNPAGRLSVSLMFFFLTLQAASGLILAGTDLYFPPFGGLIAERVAAPGVPPETLVPYAPAMVDADAYARMRELRKPVVTTHEYSFYGLLALIFAHVIAVVVTELREGGSLISAMFTGRKLTRETPVDRRDDPPQA